MRLRLIALAAAAALGAGCTDSTAPGGTPTATNAAQTLLHLADSLSAHGGTPSEVGAYRGLASLLMGTGRLSSVTISVDGAPSEYLATAQEIRIDDCPPGAICSLMLAAPVRSVVAWEKSNPRRAVQLFMADFSGASWSPGTAGGSMVFLDGAGAMYGGTSTSHSISVTQSSTPCDRNEPIVAVYATAPCTQAEFDVAFDGTLTLAPLDGLYMQYGVSPSANAAPTHRVTMTSQQVHGAHTELAGLCIDSCSNPPGTTPPISTPWRDSLTATLTASVGSEVTFTFTVKNTRSTSTDVRFNDGQQFDIRVWNDKEALVWRWAADKGFTQMVTTRTLAPGESMTYVEHWTPPAAGKYRAMAYLTSSSHAAVGFTEVTAP